MNNELQNNINYIKDQAGQDPGFSIPEDYLNGIEEDFLLKLKEESMPKTTSFNIPNTYFDNLEDTIVNKVERNTREKKVISLKNSFIKFIPAAVAASVLLFIGIQFFNNEDELINFEDLTAVDVENWLEENTAYSDTELAFVFDDDLDVDELTLTNVSLNNDVIEDYLNSIDHSDLINEIQ